MFFRSVVLRGEIATVKKDSAPAAAMACHMGPLQPTTRHLFGKHVRQHYESYSTNLPRLDPTACPSGRGIHT